MKTIEETALEVARKYWPDGADGYIDECVEMIKDALAELSSEAVADIVKATGALKDIHIIRWRDGYAPEEGDVLFAAPPRLDEYEAGYQAGMKERQEENAELRAALAESQANDRCAMGYLAEVRAIVGGDDFPDMVERVDEYRKALQMAREALKRHSDHYECEDTFYSCPAHETAWEGRKGECCCGADKANEALAAINKVLEQSK